MRFARFTAGLLMLPLLWAECLVIWTIMPDAFVQDFPFLSRQLMALAGGFAAWLLLAMRIPVSNWFYVFGHELTHAAWGLATLSRVSKIRITSNGGYCVVENPGMFTTLAPYFIPFYLVLALAVRAVLGIWFDMSGFATLWIGAMGFAYGFHVTSTIGTLVNVAQPDIREYGRFFSCVFIVAANLAFVAAGLALALGVPAGDFWNIARERVAGVYAATWELACAAAIRARRVAG